MTWLAKTLIRPLFFLIAGAILAIYLWNHYGPASAATGPAPVQSKDRDIARRDTSGAAAKAVRITYRTVYDTVRVEIAVPRKGPDLVGCVTAAPLTIDGRKVRLHTWSPDSLRWRTDIYRVPLPRWGWALYGLAEVPPGQWAEAGEPAVGIAALVRWRRLSVTGALRATPTGVYPAVGVRVRIAGRD